MKLLAGPGTGSVLAALGVTMPFVLALPAQHEPPAVLWGIIAAVFLAALFVARRICDLPHGGRVVAAFAALYLLLGILACMRVERYLFAHAMTDLALLYLVFFTGSVAGTVARPLGRAVLALAVLALTASSVVEALHVHIFGFPIGPEGYRAILQSNPGEVFEFIGRFVGAGALATALAGLTVALAAAFGALPVRAPRGALGWAAVFGLAAFGIAATNEPLVTPRAQGFVQAAAYVTELVEHQSVRRQRGAHAPTFAIQQHGRLAAEPQTYVVLVGESLTRNHMQLYGYWRETTPALTRLRGELTVFTDAVSPHSHTDYSLELVLTLAKQDNGLKFTDPENYGLIELLRAAGFSTWWISNQNSFGPWDNKTAVLARAAEHVHYTGARSGPFIWGPYDEALLEPYAAALRDPAPRKVIFLHFLGNHIEYAKRFPPQARVFTDFPSAAQVGALSKAYPKPGLINDYDNAVRYHDQLVARLIEMLRATARPAALVHFSDHGESVYGQKAHYWREFTHDHVEVPLLLWFSPQYAALAGGTVARARANATLPFALEDLPHLVADLAALESKVFERERSPLSEAYRPRPRPLFEGTALYEEADDPLLNARRTVAGLAAAHPKLRGTLWAHRVNTLGKMTEAARAFAGAEIDVLYDAESAAFLVNHPPDPPSGLTLDALLEHANRLNPALALWLDVKNLNEANGRQALEALERLERRHAIRARALVETDHTGPVAAALRAAGYRTSYYLPPTLLAQGTECDRADGVQRAVLERRFAAVSYDWRGRQWVERCLGRFLRERRLPVYLWDLELWASERNALEHFDEERARGYTAAAAVLLPFRSPFDDWR